jgi:hypothetical protein
MMGSIIYTLVIVTHIFILSTNILILIFFFPKTHLPRITTAYALSLPLNGGAISTSISAILRRH